MRAGPKLQEVIAVGVGSGGHERDDGRPERFLGFVFISGTRIESEIRKPDSFSKAACQKHARAPSLLPDSELVSQA